MNHRIEYLFRKNFSADTSFTTRPSILESIFGGHKFKINEVREIWHQGIKVGIETGLREASIEGQIINMQDKTINSKQKEFLEKFYELCNEYNCGVKYHREYGMIVMDMDKEGNFKEF